MKKPKDSQIEKKLEEILSLNFGLTLSSIQLDLGGKIKQAIPQILALFDSQQLITEKEDRELARKVFKEIMEMDKIGNRRPRRFLFTAFKKWGPLPGQCSGGREIMVNGVSYVRKEK